VTRDDAYPVRRLGGTSFSGLRLGLLGPLMVWRDGAPVPLGTGRERAVLGLLGLHLVAGVHRDAIVDVLWGENRGRGRGPGRAQTARLLPWRLGG
jgi:hypothetical protein